MNGPCVGVTVALAPVCIVVCLCCSCLRSHARETPSDEDSANESPNCCVTTQTVPTPPPASAVMPSQSSPSSSPATMTTSSSTLASASYKGKTANRSWNTLPAEILRLIVTHFLLDASLTGYLPQTWENRERWLPRMAYNVVRDANALETIMKVSPAWKAASEFGFFVALFPFINVTPSCGHDFIYVHIGASNRFDVSSLYTPT